MCRTRAGRPSGPLPGAILPLHGFTQHQIWCEIVAQACELLAWKQMLALTSPARTWEPKRLRLRISACAGRIVRGSPPPAASPRPALAIAPEIITAITRLQALAPG
jgi:hypothetical protein